MVPSSREVRMVSTQHRAFIAVAPFLWNSLSVEPQPDVAADYACPPKQRLPWRQTREALASPASTAVHTNHREEREHGEEALPQQWSDEELVQQLTLRFGGLSMPRGGSCPRTIRNIPSKSRERCLPTPSHANPPTGKKKGRVKKRSIKKKVVRNLSAVVCGTKYQEGCSPTKPAVIALQQDPTHSRTPHPPSSICN